METGRHDWNAELPLKWTGSYREEDVRKLDRTEDKVGNVGIRKKDPRGRTLAYFQNPDVFELPTLRSETLCRTFSNFELSLEDEFYFFLEPLEQKAAAPQGSGTISVPETAAPAGPATPRYEGPTEGI